MERATMDSEISQEFADVRGTIARVEATLSEKIEKLGADLRAEVAAARKDAIQHADVGYEKLHDDIKVIAEGFATVSVRQIEFSASQASMRARVDSIADGQDALRVRVESIAKGQEALTSRVDTVVERVESLGERFGAFETGQAAINAKLDRLLPPGGV